MTTATHLIKKNIPLSDKNWFQTGSTAEYYSEPENTEEIIQSIRFAKKNNLQITILGSGANILISDSGLNGLAVKPSGKSIKIIGVNNKDNAFVEIDSGVFLDNAINWCLDNNIIGLEEFSGIPANIGGAVYQNIHYFQFKLHQFIESIELIDLSENKPVSINSMWLQIKENQDKIENGIFCIASATFKLTKCSDFEREYAKGRSKEITRHRLQRYPYKGTCGSFFKNLNEKNIAFTINGKKVINAAYYLEQVGSKNIKHGNAYVSYKHSNMIVNNGGCKSSDIVKVAKKMQELVMKKFGLLLEPECRLLGFNKYPLLKVNNYINSKAATIKQNIFTI
jgi:UDP-N-acetylmuramate dehydrogenase